jgi:CheY-like chemotaxis protein
VLVVEDNDDAREMLCAFLRALGHETHEAADGVAGVAAALDLAPDLTLIDIGLPGIDGYEVSRRIRAAAAGGHLRLVALTGYGMPEDRARAIESGFDAHLVKPVDPAKLTALLAGEPSR